MRPYLLLIPACLTCTVPAVGDEFPKRKPGLWEISVMVGGRKLPSNMLQCTDPATDAEMATNLSGVESGKCSKPVIKRSGQDVTVDATCKIGTTTTATRAVFSGDFDRAYTIAVTKRPPGQENASSPPGGAPHMLMEAKWLGPCREGQRPGDIVMPGGFKVNVLELSGGAKQESR